MKHARKLKTINAPTTAFGFKKSITASTDPKISPAQAAFLNVTSRGLSSEFFEAAAAKFMNNDMKGFSTLILSGAEKVRRGESSPEQIEEKTYSFLTDLTSIPAEQLRDAYATPPRTFKGPVSHAGHAARKLSRRADCHIVAAFERSLDLKHETHGEGLVTLKTQQPSVYDALICGFPTAALERARIAGKHAFTRAAPVVEDHIMFLMVASAHLRLKSTNNLCRGFAGNTKWKTLAEVSKAVMIGPAIVLQNLLGLALFSDMTDDQALSVARAAGLLPNNDDAENIISIAKRVRSRLPEHALSRENFELQISRMAQRSKPASLLTQKTLADAEFTRTTFTQWIFKVSTSEAAVILAMDLLCARTRIKACINAIEGGRALPVIQPCANAQELRDNVLSRLTDALRVEAQSDKNAKTQLGSEENHNSKKLVQHTRERIRNNEVAPALSKLLLDPIFYFRRELGE